MNGAVVLDSDVLSELSRGNPRVVRHARRYLNDHGRFTITSVTVFERLRGYRSALAAGKSYEAQLRQFEGLVATCIVLPFDEDAAGRSAAIWAGLSTKQRRELGDILIAGIAGSRGLPLATRNLRDFRPIAAMEGARLTLADWSR